VRKRRGLIRFLVINLDPLLVQSRAYCSFRNPYDLLPLFIPQSAIRNPQFFSLPFRSGLIHLYQMAAIFTVQSPGLVPPSGSSGFIDSAYLRPITLPT
jgi:hypothetical protein